MGNPLPYARINTPPADLGVPILVLQRGPSRQLRVTLFDPGGDQPAGAGDARGDGGRDAGGTVVYLREWTAVETPGVEGGEPAIAWWPRPGRVIGLHLAELPELIDALSRIVDNRPSEYQEHATMSDPTGIYGTKPAKPSPQGDYTLPIARNGEQQFAVICRQRSGMDAGSIDAGSRDITHLCDADKRDAVEAAFDLYERFCRQTGMKARRDRSGEGQGT